MAAKKAIWTIPKLWPDGECFILGGGPSLKNIDVSRLRGHRVIAVNNAYQLGDFIDVMFFGDCRWFHLHKKQLLSFAGLKLTTCEQHVKYPGIKVVRRKTNINGLSNNPGLLAWNLSSGACAINVATLLGVKRIVLLGFDMQKIDGHSNWHKDHGTSNNPKHNPYRKFMSRFAQIAKSLQSMNVECINATPGSALTEFPIVEPETVMPERKETCVSSVS